MMSDVGALGWSVVVRAETRAGPGTNQKKLFLTKQRKQTGLVVHLASTYAL
jgi:hypothetical protein